MKIFWSWQSDHNGKISRYFIRDALRDAVRKIKADPDIVEPSERESLDALHVDQDRQDIPGSPNIADTILEKIDTSIVVVADVTPVARGEVSSENPSGRAVMNPNVAIELGYALGKLGTNRILMVLNENFGNRGDLPFDLRHKAGPLLYNLSGDSSPTDQLVERGRLTDAFVGALRPYLRSMDVSSKETLPFQRAATGANPGVWFQENEPLLYIRNIGGQRGLVLRPSPLMFLRVIPTKSLQRQWAASEARSIASQLPLLSGSVGGWNDNNKYGAVQASSENSDGEIGVATQLFYSGEVWFANNHLMERILKHQYIDVSELEKFLMKRIPVIIKSVIDLTGMELPFEINFGFLGIRGVRFETDSYHTDSRLILGDPESTTFRVTEISSNGFDDILLEIFNGIFWGLIRERRPENFNGFPATSNGQG